MKVTGNRISGGLVALFLVTNLVSAIKKAAKDFGKPAELESVFNNRSALRELIILDQDSPETTAIVLRSKNGRDIRQAYNFSSGTTYYTDIALVTERSPGRHFIEEDDAPEIARRTLAFIKGAEARGQTGFDKHKAVLRKYAAQKSPKLYDGPMFTSY